MQYLHGTSRRHGPCVWALLLLPQILFVLIRCHLPYVPAGKKTKLFGAAQMLSGFMALHAQLSLQRERNTRDAGARNAHIQELVHEIEKEREGHLQDLHAQRQENARLQKLVESFRTALATTKAHSLIKTKKERQTNLCKTATKVHSLSQQCSPIEVIRVCYRCRQPWGKLPGGKEFGH